MGSMSDYLDPNNEELLKDFFAEAEQQVETLESNILIIESDPSNREAVDEILQQAKDLEKAGAFSVVLEMVPQESAKYISENLSIPTISCGAGKYCDAQVLVSDDVFGKYSEFTPKFARKYGDMKNFIIDCAKKFDEDVKTGKFPAETEVF